LLRLSCWQAIHAVSAYFFNAAEHLFVAVHAKLVSAYNGREKLKLLAARLPMPLTLKVLQPAHCKCCKRNRIFQLVHARWICVFPRDKRKQIKLKHFMLLKAFYAVS
jgi:hypothetical protein